MSYTPNCRCLPGNLGSKPGWLFDILYLGDYPNYLGIIISTYKDPYKPISIIECHISFERCSVEVFCVSFFFPTEDFAFVKGTLEKIWICEQNGHKVQKVQVSWDKVNSKNCIFVWAINGCCLLDLLSFAPWCFQKYPTLPEGSIPKAP